MEQAGLAVATTGSYETAPVSEVLIASGDDRVRRTMCDHVTARGYETVVMTSGGECIDRFRTSGTDAIVACLPLRDMTGRGLLRELRAADDNVNVIVTGTDDEIISPVDAFEHGAFEYIADPLDRHQDLLAALGLALGSRRGDLELRYLKERQASEAENHIVARCAQMQTVMRVVKQVCARTANASAAPTILITGETGTGKGMLAKYIHYHGGRRTRPFVVVNCAAIPPQLLEAEVFGHERGAFTDARTRKLGLMETAHGGTLFLDEIGALPLAAQAKLLTAIEEKQIRRVGGVESIHVDTQILAATHADLRSLSATGAFRADLYHRLNVVSVKLPPLRERGRDAVHIAEQIIRQTCQSYGLPPRHLSDAAQAHIQGYEWPGNIREMRNVIERIVLLHDAEVVEESHFDSVRSIKPPPESDRFAVYLPEGGVSLWDVEKEVITQALDMCEGNVSKAARYLQITRQTLIYRMKKHGLGRQP